MEEGMKEFDEMNGGAPADEYLSLDFLRSVA